ncbi:N-acetyltransferase [Rugamonas sp. CCM 8940]|nr:N-acetyltransferase [Rugamonas sp. CCM 8940]
MYAWRGYSGSHVLSDDPNRITLTASDKGEAVGTLTLGIDAAPIGLLADEIFRDEIAPYRGPGKKLCEITKFAFDPRVRSKEPMAALFHLSTLMARDIHGCTDLFIEVNPRHRAFYENKLGFTCLGEPKSNPRVNAPAYLLWLSYAYVTEQINRFGGNPPEAAGNRSFYPLFYSPREEQGLISRLRENR